MKIGIIAAIDFENNQPVGGILGFIKNIIPYFKNETILFGYSIDKEKVNKKFLKNNLTIINLFQYNILSSKYPLRILSVYYYLKNIKRILSYDVNVFYIHSEELFLPFFFVNKKKYKFVFHMHGANLANENARFVFARNKLFSVFWENVRNYALRKADKIIAIDDDSYEILMKKKFENKTIIIRNAVDSNKFKYLPEVRTYQRRKLKIEDQIFSLLYVGRLEKFKRIEQFIDVVDKLKRENKSVNGLIVGEGSLQNELEKRIITANLKNEIRILGALTQEALVKIYNAADILFLPSHHEGTPMVLLEALASGLPVIAYNIGGISEIIKDKLNGFLLNDLKMDSITIAEKITLVIKDKIFKDREMIRKSIINFFADNIVKKMEIDLFK